MRVLDAITFSGVGLNGNEDNIGKNSSPVPNNAAGNTSIIGKTREVCVFLDEPIEVGSASADNPFVDACRDVAAGI